MPTYGLAIANDHAGYNLKLKILEFLGKADYQIYKQNQESPVSEGGERGIRTVLDLGSYSQEPVDYPDYAKKVVQAISEGIAEYGILICSTGIGMAIAANRSPAIRAALCWNDFMAGRARAHNDANILVLGSELTDEQVASRIVEKFLGSRFEGGRHQERVRKLV